MKIVINTQHGGFGLSNVAKTRVAELLGKTAYFFKRNKVGFAERYVPTDVNYIGLLCFVFDIPNPNDVFETNKAWSDMTPEERETSNRLFTEHEIPDYERERSHPNLIKVVEELGALANTRFCSLKIIEVPDDVKWHIEEYDGLEHVAEDHRTWY